MSTTKKLSLLLFTLILTACAGLSPVAPNAAGMPVAALPQAEATQTPPLVQAPADATATATPFQPLAELLRPERKTAVIEWIRATSLPSRFKRRLLQDWGAAVGVELAGADYEAVTREDTR